MTQPESTFPNTPDVSPSHFEWRQFTPEAITAALPIVVTLTAHGFSNGQALRATKFYRLTTGMEQLQYKNFYVQQATDDTFQLYDASGYPIDGRGYTAYISGGEFTLTGPTLPIENPSPEPPSGVPAFPPV